MSFELPDEPSQQYALSSLSDERSRVGREVLALRDRIVTAGQQRPPVPDEVVNAAGAVLAHGYWYSSRIDELKETATRRHFAPRDHRATQQAKTWWEESRERLRATDQREQLAGESSYPNEARFGWGELPKQPAERAHHAERSAVTSQLNDVLVGMQVWPGPHPTRELLDKAGAALAHGDRYSGTLTPLTRQATNTPENQAEAQRTKGSWQRALIGLRDADTRGKFAHYVKFPDRVQALADHSPARSTAPGERNQTHFAALPDNEASRRWAQTETSREEVLAAVHDVSRRARQLDRPASALNAAVDRFEKAGLDLAHQKGAHMFGDVGAKQLHQAGQTWAGATRDLLAKDPNRSVTAGLDVRKLGLSTPGTERQNSRGTNDTRSSSEGRRDGAKRPEQTRTTQSR